METTELAAVLPDVHQTYLAVPTSAPPAWGAVFALALGVAGRSVATIAAMPLGSYLGGVIGWRNVFLATAGLGAAAFVWQFLVLPSLAPAGQARPGTLLAVARRPRVGMGLLAVILAFSGHLAFFTYLRPFLETVTGVSVKSLSALLLGFGAANFVSNSLAGPLLRRHLRPTLTLTPLLMSLLAAGLLALGHLPLVVAVLVALWGAAIALVPVGWSTWVTRTVPDEAESGILLLLATGATVRALRPGPAPATGR